MNPLNFPMLWLVIAQLTGILLVFYFPDTFSKYTGPVLLILFLFVYLLARWAWLKDLALLLAFCCFSLFYFQVIKGSTCIDKYLLIKVSSVKQKEYGLQAEAIELKSGEKLLVYTKDSIKLGAIILTRNTLKKVNNSVNPFQFDYANYLHKKGVSRSLWIQENEFLKLGEHGGIKSGANQLKKILSGRLEEFALNNKATALYKSLLLGDRSEIEAGDKALFSQLGISHVLAVSGLHVGAIYLLLGFLFSWLTQNWRLLAVLLGIWLFAAISGFSPSVSRASFMFSFLAIAKAVQKRQSAYQAIYLSAFVLLLINPYNLFSIGFQLSYLAVLGIIYLHPRLMQLGAYLPSWINKILALLFLSLAAQLATFPLTQFHFHSFPLSFLLSNIWVVPFISLILYISLPLLLLSYLLPGNWISLVLDFLANLFHKGVHFQAEYVSTVWNYAHFKWFDVILMYAIILSFFLWWFHKKRWAALAFLGIFILFFSSILVTNWELDNRQELWIYNQDNKLNILALNGRKVHQAAGKYHADSYVYLGARELTLSSGVKSFYYGNLLFYLGLPSKIEYPESVDVFMISAKAYLNPEDLRFLVGKKLIVYGKASKAKRKFLENLDCELWLLDERPFKLSARRGTSLTNS